MKFRRRIGAERVMLMLPFNVVLIGRIRGAIDPEKIAPAFEALRNRHPLLGVRTHFEDGMGWYETERVPDIPVHIEKRENETQWVRRVEKELQTSFPIETGPLFRCAVIHSIDISEIILCGHHAICDGMSLGYLLRDLLSILAEPDQNLGDPIIPPPIDHTTVPNPPSTNPVMRFIMNSINKAWAAKDIAFTEVDRQHMHDEFWKRNDSLQVLAWDMNVEDTSHLVNRCRAEHVTVNSTLWTAFLKAQYEIHGDRQRYRQRSGMAVNNRDKLTVPPGEAFGFYASSLTVKLPYKPQKSFWENARHVHAIILKELEKTDLFRMLTAELMHPTLLDSLYFQKYGFLNERMPKKLLKRMNWHEITYGCALTNVGRFDIPTTYGPYRLEGVYGPLFYSDIEDNMVGVITVGGRLSFILASNITGSDALSLRNKAMKYLEQAVG